MKNVVKRLAYSFFTIILAVTAIFFVIRMAPGDPVSRILGPEASLEEVFLYRQQLGLDLPLYKQYITYFLNLSKGDLGSSLYKKKDVFSLIKARMIPTFTLALLSIFISCILGTFLGALAAFYKSKTYDNVSRTISLLALSFPIFSLAPILVYIFAIKLKLVPVSEWGEIRHAILPVVTLVIPLSSIILRVARNKYLEESSAPWITVLKAKGMSEFGVFLRLVKVCLPSILNVVAIQLSIVLAGAMISETIFDIPGMGSLLFEGIQNRDYPIVQGVIIYSTIIYMCVYFLIDYLNSLIDPRIEF
ncbi:MAG: ABC transporter permease [Bacteriovoracaceae bacterium]|nr:ABC transporter permease [Bacteriovoracaceae bacterium]